MTLNPNHTGTERHAEGPMPKAYMERWRLYMALDLVDTEGRDDDL